nr:MAG TPA: hypothetical protein [Caudoviricetes sp.]
MTSIPKFYNIDLWLINRRNNTYILNILSFPTSIVFNKYKCLSVFISVFNLLMS